MAITPGPGYKVDPSNPNAVVPIGSAATINNPNTVQPVVSNTSITRTNPTTPVQGTSNTVTYNPTSTPSPTYSGPVNNSINNTPQGNALVQSNQQQAAALGVSIPGVGGSQGLVPVQPQSQQPLVNPTYGSLTSAAANAAQNGSPQTSGLVGQIAGAANSNPLTSGGGYDTYNAAVQAQSKLKQDIAKQYGGIESQAIPLYFQQGREQVLAKQYASQLDAAQQAVNAAQTAMGYGLTQQQQQISGLTGAAGASNTQQSLLQSGLQGAAGLASPVQVPYNNQFLSPTTGQPVNGGASGAGGDMQGAVNLHVQRVNAGLEGYSDAVSALGAYGQGGVNALNSALGPGFGLNQSNANAAAQQQALAQNVQQGRSSALATTSAVQALDALQSAYNGLSNTQQGGIPFVNFNSPLLSQIAQFGSMETGVGRSAASNYLGALNEARAQVRGVLGAAGVNPLDAGSISDALLPNNMTPQELPQKISAAKQYLANRVAALSQTGNVPQYGQTTTPKPAATTGFSW